ncbi:MAG: adenylate/guanylate cyclase domain-containing protein [Pseudomonadales bacterium]
MKNSKPSMRMLGAAALLCTLFSLTQWGLQLDNLVYDTLELGLGEPVSADDIVVIGIDEPSFQQLELQWPWPRRIHARLLKTLAKEGASVVAFDLLFPERSNEQDDEIFAAAIKGAMPVVVGTDFKKIIRPEYTIKTPIPPIDTLVVAGAVVGHVSIPADRDSFVRRIQPVVEKTPSLAVAAKQLFAQGFCCDLTAYPAQILIDFTGGLPAIKQVSYSQALNAATDLPPGLFKDKLVLVGVTSISASLPDRQHTDHYATPLSRSESGYTAGVLIHAFIAASLLEQSWNNPVPKVPCAIMGLVAALLFARFGVANELRYTMLKGVLLLGVIITIAIYLFVAHRWYATLVPLTLPTLLLMLVSPYHNFLIERRRKQEIRKAFSSYVNESIVKQIENDPDALKLGGKQVDGTVLFMDMVGFSTLTEKESPETMITFINEFLSDMIEIGMRHGGTVERFLGDAIMLIWGAPVEIDDHAERACTTAIEMHQRIVEIARHTRERYGFDVGARIGINGGSMTAGNIGGKNRFAYTVLGDCVNLAARFEAANKKYGSTIIVGKDTIERLRERNNDGLFEYRLMDVTRVKGREKPEELYELLGLVESLPKDSPARQAQLLYGSGLQLLLENRAADALSMFEKAAGHSPLAGVELMQQRCRQLLASPLPAEREVVFDISG